MVFIAASQYARCLWIQQNLSQIKLLLLLINIAILEPKRGCSVAVHHIRPQLVETKQGIFPNEK
ncbi:MAG: hypothetical protein A2284_19445 [Deltaproteobacteria bacterium RIFOXYA12_FULL_61_11]|nr:MAG: hypothetical protein A2284_19445 [Deltaproteobacteria bacterium RIFOXYA12_FULL_61_11]